MTITVRLSEKVEADLRSRLTKLEIPLSEFVRQAITEKLEREPVKKPSAYEQGKHLFGKYASGQPNLARDHKRIYREKLLAKHSR